MKKLTLILPLLLLLGFAGISFAEPAADVVQTTTLADPAQPVTEALPAAVPAAAPAADKGDTAWMIVATVLVILMVIPGLALFYGGMVRAKNMLSILMQVFVIFSLMAVLWAIYGYSVAFTEGNAFFGGFSKMFLIGITPDSLAATFSKGVYVPEFIYVAFQLTFSAITPALIIGALAERVKFSAVLLFVFLWFSFAYLPMAHMVWFWAGPDAYTDAKAAEAAGATAGFLFQKGALDFAGGTVVHINSGIAGLVGCILVGKRIGLRKEFVGPHSVTMTMIGASLLWVGWFGFNVGSNLEANGLAALVFVNTLLASAAATLSWIAAEWLLRGKASMLGAASGSIAGLVAITPACGWAGPVGSIFLGLVVGAACFWAVTGLKAKFGYDDALDAFGVHGVGGIIGALGTAIVANPAMGGTGVWDYVANGVAEYSLSGQLISQLWGVGVCIIWSGLVSFIAFKFVDMIIGLRVTEEVERVGLDVSEHGETAYHI
ncbi:ammonium transporter [Methylomicrobium sp. RS1]|jgi:Amt family ammonium transporter|uniref:ammonium transporter n=1 Tax=Candidatus Methylomicrobium oryzae TaxID=2802053 RepID=UPI001923341C|nr:ammonium transporter [Methylomicrobium sp. RS1]MBL1265446.1 ammonium transporter [Methylomicrobium sp. RS1]